MSNISMALSGALVFENSDWMTTKEVAVYLRKFKKNGTPSEGAIHTMVYRGLLRPVRLCRRLYFRRKEVFRLLGGATF